MGEEPINLVLEHLRAIRGDLGSQREILREHGERLTRIELAVARQRRDQAQDAESVAHMETRLDRLRDDVDLIKRRLDLREA